MNCIIDFLNELEVIYPTMVQKTMNLKKGDTVDKETINYKVK
jgi:hypothetical protein